MYICEMPRQQKTPQEKKQLELKKDHFTFTNAPHAFRKNWKKKKAKLNRQYRRKSDEILATAKGEVSVNDAECLVGDVTASHLENSISKKRLRKRGTVLLEKKIEIKSRVRQEKFGRRVESRRKSDQAVANAISTLTGLQGDKLIQLVNRIAKIVKGGDSAEWVRVYLSKDPADRAIFFVEQIERGDWTLGEALRRDQELCKSFKAWF